MQSTSTQKQSHSLHMQGQNISIPMQLKNILLKLLKSAQDVLTGQGLQVLTKIIQETGRAAQNSIECIQRVLFLLLSQIQILQQKNTISMTHQDYQVLEQSLQKSESEVRKHIRIEQQLKIYLDGLEEKNQSLQKQVKIEEDKYYQLFESIRSLDQEKKQLHKKLKKIEQQNKYLTEKQKLKGHKSAKIISQSLSRPENYSLICKSKPTLSNNHHSKSKTSQKSFQKQTKQYSSGFEAKSSKMKLLHSQIEVNLSKNMKTQPKQAKRINDETFIPTEQDVRIFREMTKTVQMKQAYKRPVRKAIKYKTQPKQGKQMKDSKNSTNLPQNRQYRSVSVCK